jgi:hypothetical protein
MTISAELSGALRYCGDIRGERLELPDVYEFWLDACSMMDADLQITEAWRNMAAAPLEITEQDQALGALPPYSFELGVDYRSRTSLDAKWRTLEVVAAERVADAERRGGYAIGFYGQPRRVLLSFDPANYEFQLWSVSTGAVDRSNPAEVSGLPETYAPLRKLLTAHFALPHCKYDTETFNQLMGVIETGLKVWMPKWEKFKDKPVKREGSRRPGYKASRGLRRARRRLGY